MSGRLHHYLFAHRDTRDAFFSDPAHLLELFRGPQAAEMAAHVWTAMGERLEAEGETALSPDGLAIVASELAGREAAVLRLPPPTEVSEAWFVAIVAASDTDAARYFTLEKTISLASDAGDEPVMFCEWTADGKHLNFGPAGGHTLEGFEAMIEGTLP